MKKILYIITQSELGGAQRNVLDLTRSLKNEYEIIVAAGPDGGGLFFEMLEKNNISCIRLKYLRRAINPFNDWLAFCEIKKLLKTEKPDILHLHSSKAGILGSVAAKKMRGGGAKIIYTVHGAVFEASFNPLLRRIFLWLEKFTARFKDKIICVSANDKKLWLKYQAAPEEKLTVIHNGVDFGTMEFLPRAAAREYLFGLSAPLFAAARGSGSDLKIIGTIANFYPEKGLEYFILAAETILKQKQKNIIFTIIGDGSQRELLEAMIKEHSLEKSFVLAGTIPNASKYLKALDVFVLSSIKEGLPYTILEAMAAQLPIVASWIGGLPEMIKNETNGFLVLPRNPEMLAEKIISLLDNPSLAQQFIRASQEKINDFSLEKMVEETKKIY